MKYLIFLIFIGFANSIFSQKAKIKGNVFGNDSLALQVKVKLLPVNIYVISDKNGHFEFENLSLGEFQIVINDNSFDSFYYKFSIDSSNQNIDCNIVLYRKELKHFILPLIQIIPHDHAKENHFTIKKINREKLSQIQACNLSEGLKFQSGLRVETNCQTCNYTQLRMNGLAGNYSQFLINGRPVFSSLMSLYGMEQMSENLIEKIEVNKGANSSLFGYSAIGGSVNVVTKKPRENNNIINVFSQLIGNKSYDHHINFNSDLVSKNKKHGISMIGNYRQRDFFDANNDNFSELPSLQSYNLGFNYFFQPKERLKLEFYSSYINEDRLGGDMSGKAFNLLEQAENRLHKILMFGGDMMWFSKDGSRSLQTFFGAQNIERKHFTGVMPDSFLERNQYIQNPPSGNTNGINFNIGSLFTQKFKLLNRIHELHAGGEFIFEKINDQIPAYNFLVNQTTKDVGIFAQGIWNLAPKIGFLTALRVDKHNFINHLMISPRSSLFYKFSPNSILKINYGRGFRAPQAFDTDIHVAMANGGVSRVSLASNLKEESSHSFNLTYSKDFVLHHKILGFSIDGFYTLLNDAFELSHIGNDTFGEVYFKKNGDKARVYGVSLEIRANFNKSLKTEAGITFQKSEFDNPVEYIIGLPSTKEFVRTPNNYGFAVIQYDFLKKFYINLNYVYTGKMLIYHFGEASGGKDEVINSQHFHDIGFKFNYQLFDKNKKILNLYAGSKNLLNQYQTNFDFGKKRDSNFIYGPSQPFTVFAGLKMNF